MRDCSSALMIAAVRIGGVLEGRRMGVGVLVA